jgi:PTS system ascorbate-specific IIB component
VAKGRHPFALFVTFRWETEMEVHKIFCCCGSGLGSSLIVRMNAEEVVKGLGRPDIEVDHTTISDINPTAADLFIVGSDLKDFVGGVPDERKVVLDNILDKEELREKLANLLG